MAGVLLCDEGVGRVTVGATRPKVHYQLDPADAQRLQRGIAAGAELYLAAGAAVSVTGHTPAKHLRSGADFAELWAASTAPGRVSLFSFHQMGTARMGGSRHHDVVDPSGALWGVPNVLVADASIFPTASGVNPQITVYALADVVADAALARL